MWGLELGSGLGSEIGSGSGSGLVLAIDTWLPLSCCCLCPMRVHDLSLLYEGHDMLSVFVFALTFGIDF